MPHNLVALNRHASFPAEAVVDGGEEMSTELVSAEDGDVPVHPPPKIATVTGTNRKFPGVPHRWLCEGRMLHLLDPLLPDNQE